MDHKIELFDALSGVELAPALDADRDTLNFELSEVVGEAIKEYKLVENGGNLNLLPLAIRQELKFIRQKPILAPMAILIAVFPWMLYLGLSKAKDLTVESSASLKEMARPFESNKAILAENTARAEVLSQSISQVEGLVDTKTNWIQFFADLQASIFNAKDVWVDDLTVIRPEAYQDEYADEYDDYGYSDSEDTGEGSEDTSLDYEVVVKGKCWFRNRLMRSIKMCWPTVSNSCKRVLKIQILSLLLSLQNFLKYLSDGLKVLPFGDKLNHRHRKASLIRPLTIMEFFQKHPIFFSCVGLCALLTAVGLIFSILGALDLGEASQRYKKADRAFNRLLASNPSPVDTNVKNSDFNVMELMEKLQSMRDELERGTGVEASFDGVRVMAGIQQYISKFKALAKDNTNDNGPAPIEIPDDFAFGFDRFKLETTVLKKQKKLYCWINKEIFSIISCRNYLQPILKVLSRSLVNLQKAMTADEEGMFSNDPSIFDISSSVTSKVEGAIDTIAFQITFLERQIH